MSREVMEDHYQVLKIRRTATMGEVRAAYLHWAKQLHPDVNQAPTASEDFQKLKEAYEVLGDEERRRNYDAVMEYTARIQRQKEEREAAAARVAFLKEQEARAQSAPKTEAPPADPAPAQRKRLADLLSRGRYKDAEDIARTLLAANGRDAMAWAALGDISRAKGELTAAAKNYAFAAQYDPSQEGYLKSHLEVVEAMKSPTGNLATDQMDAHAKSQPFSAPLAVLAGVTLCVFCWVVMDRSPLGLPIAPLSTWTMAAIAGLLVCGLALGACLSLGDIVDRLFVASRGAVSRTPPVLVLGAVSVLNFWLAVLLYLLSGIFQGAFQRTTSAMVSGTAGVVLVLALAGAFVSPGMALSVAVFGGSLVYASALLGWATADALRR